MLWRLGGPGHRACAVQHLDDQVTVWAFLDAEETTAQDLSRLWLGLHLDAAERQLPNPRLTWQKTDSWDWPEPIKHMIVPQDVGERLTVVPAGHSHTAPDRLLVHLDGRFGFGMGGMHPTTRQCLEAAERLVGEDVTAGKRPVIADIGCGAGILSIAAVKLGAERVYAVDTKSASVLGTTQNRELNGIGAERLVVKKGSVSDLARLVDDPVDGFFCNILTRIILHLIPRFDQISGPNTWGILSGIKEAELEYVDRQLLEHGWETATASTRDGWCRLEIQRV